MDPVTMIVAVLSAGAVAGLTSTAEQAIKDAYTGIKQWIQDRYPTVDLASFEKKPGLPARQEVLKEELAGAGAAHDVDLLRKVQALSEALAKSEEGRRAAQMSGVKLDHLVVEGSMIIVDVEVPSIGVHISKCDVGGNLEIREVKAGVDKGDRPREPINATPDKTDDATNVVYQSQIGGSSVAEYANLPHVNPRVDTATFRYLNAGFFTNDNDVQPISSDQPLALDGGSYRLGVNVGEFWGLGAADTPIPDDILKPFFEKTPELTLDVVLRSRTVRLPLPWQPLPLSATGNSKMLYFPIELTEPGRHSINVDLIYCGHLLQSRRVDTYIVEHVGQAPPKSIWPVQDAYIVFTRTATLDPQSLAIYDQRPSQLTIVADHSDDYKRVGLCFYRTLASEEKLYFEQSELTDTNLASVLKATRRQLKATMEAYVGGVGGSDQQLATQLGKLASIGRRFYCALLPGLSRTDRTRATPQKLLENLRPGAIIQVAPLSAQLSVPWELLYERPCMAYREGRTRLCTEFRSHGPAWEECPNHGDPFVVCPHGFWGYRYIIEQLPCRSARGDRPKPTLPMYVYNGVPLKLDALVYPKLSYWQSHRRTLEQLAQAGQVALNQLDTLDGIFAALKKPQADVLYFYTHGGRDKDSDSPCLRVANDDLLFEQDLNDLNVEFESNHPLVVLNACESATYSPTDFENFILFFCEHGAAGVIGTQCDVAERLVDGVMARFLVEFLGQRSAGEALFAARKALLFNDRPDPRGLVYSLFAAADLKLAEEVKLKQP